MEYKRGGEKARFWSKVGIQRAYKGRTPLITLLDGKDIWAEKNLAQI